MENCPFCRKEVISSSFAQESNFYAVYNHAPVVPGHVMVIPYNHVTNMFDLSDSDYTSLFIFAKKITAFINEYYQTNEFDMSLQQGFNAGQSVEHLHLHIIPRRANDLPEGEEWFHKLNDNKTALLDSGRFLSDTELASISEQLKTAWNKYLNKEK